MFSPNEWPIAWMARAERQHARNATVLLAPLGLHHREFRLMAMLANADGLTVGELAELAVLERPTVSKMADRLQAVGWVQRESHSQDRRRCVLRLTPNGRATFDAAVPVVEGLFQRYQSGVPELDQARFIAEVEAFYQRVHRARPQEPSVTSTEDPGGRHEPQP